MSEEINNNNGTEGGGEVVTTKKNNSSFGVGGVGSLALIGLVLIVILTILIVRSQNSEHDVLTFAPADSFYALEVENIEGAADVLVNAQLWREDSVSKESILDEFSAFFGSDKDVIQRFAGNIKSVTFIESFVDRKPEKLLVLKVGNGWDIERYYKREYSKVTTPVKFDESMRGIEVTRPDSSIFYLKKVASFVLISESRELMLRSLASYQENELSLAQCNIRFGDGEDEMPRVRLYTAINSYLMNYPEYEKKIPETFSKSIAGDSAFLYEATLTETGFVAEGRFIKNEAAGYASGMNSLEHSGGGFFSTLFTIILYIIVIVIALPVLFVAFTLLLALYFFLVAWWKGELVPIDPPLKDLSNNLKEDLGVKEEKKEEAISPSPAETAPADMTPAEESQESGAEVDSSVGSVESAEETADEKKEQE